VVESFEIGSRRQSSAVPKRRVVVEVPSAGAGLAPARRQWMVRVDVSVNGPLASSPTRKRVHVPGPVVMNGSAT